MKILAFSVDRLRLLRIVERLEPICPRSSLSPIMECLKVTARDGRIEIVAKNGECDATSWCTAKVDRPWSACLNARELRTFLKECVEDELSFVAEANNILIEGGHSRYQMPHLPSDIFVDVPREAGLKPPVEVMSGVILDLFRLAASSVADRADSRVGSLNGILWKVEGGMVEMQATDQHSYVSVKGKAPFQNDGLTEKVVVSDETFKTLLRLADREGEVVKVSASRNNIYFDGDSFRLRYQLLAANWPKAKEGVKKNHKTTCTMRVQAGKLKQALRQTGVIGDRYMLRVEPGNLHLLSQFNDPIKNSLSRSELDLPLDDVTVDEVLTPGSEGEGENIYDKEVLNGLLRNLPDEALLSFRLGGETPGVIQALGGDYFAGIVPMSKKQSDPEPPKKKGRAAVAKQEAKVGD